MSFIKEKVKDRENTQVAERRFYSAKAPISIPEKLNKIAEQYLNNGWEVRRGLAGLVILKLDDGEVHYVPRGKGVEEIIFQNIH